jgi:TetR/AcrR family tetracycline transcriptional repressor
MGTTAKRRARLGRTEVIAGALALLDEVGLEALTMRRLASSLGVQAGTLYWHFADKQDLQDAMAEEIASGVLVPELKGSWQDQLAELSRRLLAALTRHRDGARILVETIKPGPNLLSVSERFLRILRDAGFQKGPAMSAAGVASNFVVGFAVDLEALEAAKRRGGVMASFRSIKERIDPAEYPLIAQVDEKMVAKMIGARDIRARFDFGLQVILRGLEHSIAPRPARRRARSK